LTPDGADAGSVDGEVTVTAVRGLPAASFAIIPVAIVMDAFASADVAVTVLVTSPVGSVETGVSPVAVDVSVGPPPPGLTPPFDGGGVGPVIETVFVIVQPGSVDITFSCCGLEEAGLSADTIQ